ncbi:hypothetical protein ACFOY8_14935 [Thalassospira xianhensis]|uniref:Uncharacterized protein n=1 Tax=Thalassospira xianhensis MCCC 1A02616 TaxID=1177929 RepID=A0A367UHB9_9PROT|nr:hypothetical protein [Thalassospira xianhensis]RCK07559.1 hypothetical protein TH5_00290 [Thalassospira xianhensis MCCC 1A02616]
MIIDDVKFVFAANYIPSRPIFIEHGKPLMLPSNSQGGKNIYVEDSIPLTIEEIDCASFVQAGVFRTGLASRESEAIELKLMTDGEHFYSPLQNSPKEYLEHRISFERSHIPDDAISLNPEVVSRHGKIKSSDRGMVISRLLEHAGKLIICNGQAYCKTGEPFFLYNPSTHTFSATMLNDWEEYSSPHLVRPDKIHDYLTTYFDGVYPEPEFEGRCDISRTDPYKLEPQKALLMKTCFEVEREMRSVILDQPVENFAVYAALRDVMATPITEPTEELLEAADAAIALMESERWGREDARKRLSFARKWYGTFPKADIAEASQEAISERTPR